MTDANHLVTAAFKTVETFAGIVKRRIWLKNGKEAKTDGNEIVVPFNDDDFYLLVERQLAHILFRSDAKARAHFVDSFLKKTTSVAQQVKVSTFQAAVDESEMFDKIKSVMERVIDILESHRIESLWGMIYPGSYQRSRDRLQMETAKLLPRAHENFFDLLVCLDAGLDVPVQGDLERFRPLFEEALRKVERRGFTATLVLSRWLIVHLVNELLREDRGEPTPGPGSSQQRGEEQKKDEYHAVPDEKSTPEKPDAGVKASARERMMAFQSLAHQFGELPPVLEKRYNDYNTSTRKQDDFYSQPKSAAQTALELDMNDAERVEQVLDESEGHMRSFLDDIQKQLVRPVDHDDWLKKDSFCKLKFVDVRPDDFTLGPQIIDELQPGDRDIVQRLRSTFYRVMGRRASRLEEYGTEVDIPAFIERLITNQPIPCFRNQVSGRGFKAMVLIDRSHSMRGNRIQQAERAAKIIVEALDFPFVELSLWGFQSLEDGEVTITRFSTDLNSFQTDKSPVDGMTPLHIALRVAFRDLTEGSDTKQLFILTDGAPMYAGGNRRLIAERQLRLFVREEIQKARRHGVNVTALLIGDSKPNGNVSFDVSRKDLAFMFGSERYWKCVDEYRFGDDLIKAVTTSFTAYLSTN